MEVEYLLTDEDAIASNIYYFEGLSWGRRHPQWPWWLILAVVAISFGSFAPQIDPQSFLVMILIAAGTIGWAVYSLATWRTRIANQPGEPGSNPTSPNKCGANSTLARKG